MIYGHYTDCNAVPVFCLWQNGTWLIIPYFTLFIWYNVHMNITGKVEIMERIVVYTSSTGFTKQYAEWIAEDLQCEAAELKNVTEEKISQYDMVIFGGWIMGNAINGLQKLTEMNPKELAVFAVGATPDEIAPKDVIIESNHLEEVPFFYMVGGFRFKELNFAIRAMLKGLRKSAAKKANKTEQEAFMAEALGTTFDNSDKKYIQPLVEFVTK